MSGRSARITDRKARRRRRRVDGGLFLREGPRVMNDGHLNRQHRLQYVVRGPEWAFAVPAGDLDALWYKEERRDVGRLAPQVVVGCDRP